MVQRFDFTSIRNTALNLVKKFGRSCVLIRPIEATAVDPSKPWRVGDGTNILYPFIGTYSALPFPRLSDPSADQSDADIIMPGDVITDSLGNVSATPIEPLVTDRIQVIGTIAGEVDPIYAVIGVRRIDPSGSAIIFSMRVRAWPSLVSAPPPGM